MGNAYDAYLTEEGVCRLGAENSQIWFKAGAEVRERKWETGELHVTWLRMAAAKPAMMPLPRLMPNIEVLERFRFFSSLMLRNTSSWQNSFTVNCPIAYGICLHRRQATSVTNTPSRLGHALAEDREESSVELAHASFAREAGKPGDETSCIVAF